MKFWVEGMTSSCKAVMRSVQYWWLKVRPQRTVMAWCHSLKSLKVCTGKLLGFQIESLAKVGDAFFPEAYFHRLVAHHIGSNVGGEEDVAGLCQ